MTDEVLYDEPVIIVTARSWFDTRWGNSYFTAAWRQVCPRVDTTVGVSVRSGVVPFTYGHGDETIAREVELAMRDAGYTVTDCAWLFDTTTVRRRADLHLGGK